MDDLVGFLVVVLPWDSYFTNILRRCQRHGGCSPQHMWRPLHLPAGPEAIFLGEGDLHDTSYDYMEVDRVRSVHAT
jgi:hypothetical protein